MRPMMLYGRNRVGAAGATAVLLVTVLVFGAGCGTDAGPELDGVPPGGAAAEPAGEGAPLARNVVLLSIDTLRADRLETYGYDRPTSPNLAALGRRSVVFEVARAQSSQTAPSHASLFTSEYVGAHGVANVHGASTAVRKLPPAVTTLAELLARDGIETAAFVSGGNLTRRMEMDRGFGVWDEPQGNPDVSDRVERLLEWIQEPERGRFFAVLHTYQVHAPYLPPPDMYPAFVDRAYRGPLRERLERFLALSPDEQWAGGVGPEYWDGMVDWTEDDVRFLSDLYDAEIQYTDSVIRRVMEAVLTTDLKRDTVIVVVSDHGEEFRDHRKFQHDQVYEEHLRVPLMIRMPGPLEHEGWRGRRTTPVNLVDVAPTTAELLGLDWSECGWEGRSLVPLLGPDAESPEGWRERPSFAQLILDLGEGPGLKLYRSVSWQGWKYIHVYQKKIDRVWESLYDLERDPLEQNDLLAEGAGALDEQAARRHEALVALLDQHTSDNLRKAQRLGDAETEELDEEYRALLEQLGYLGGEDR